MRLRDKLILAGLVLATGGSGAFWFRKTGNEPVAEAPNRRLVLREEFRPNAPTDGAVQTPGANSVTAPVPSGPGPSAPRTYDRESPLPNISPNFQPAFSIRNPRSADKPALQAASASSPLSFGGSSPNEPSSFPPLSSSIDSPSEPEQPVTHRVVDGDTLARLAEMYLGNASRRLEIFEANRGLLKDPEVLPIGAEITIPPKNPIAVAADANAPRPLVPLRHSGGG